MVREAVYDDLLPTERSHWHRELASCLERTADGGRGAGYAERAAWIAHHWLAAGDRVRALDASIRAGEAAGQAAAFGEASRHYRTAADLCRELGDPVAGSGSWTLSQLLERAASASYMAGDPDRAVAEVTEAIELTDAERERTRVGLMYERRAHFRWWAGHPHDQALKDHMTAVDLVPDEPTPARAHVLAALGADLMLSNRFSESIAVTEQALTLAREVGSPPEVVSNALSTLAVSRAYSGEIADGVRLADESVQVAAQAADPDTLYRAYGNFSCVLMLSDLRQSVRVALEGAERAERQGLAPTYSGFLICDAIASLLALGELAQAAALLADTPTLATEPVARANLLLSSVVLAGWRGDTAAVDRDLADIDGILARGGHADMRGRLAVAATEAATWCRAYPAGLRYLIAAADADTGTDDIDLRPLVAAVGLRLLADWPCPDPGTEQQREALARRMLALAADPRCRNAPGVQGRACVLTARAEASRLAGASDADLWHAAAQAWELVPAPHRAAYARLRLAEALLAGKGQRQRAKAEIGAVLDVAAQLGAGALAEEASCLAERARLGPAIARPAEDADHFGLTRRERDVLGLVCAGRTNRQIAAQLFISPKTAELHVSRILAKLSVTTRVEAAALAHRAGLDRGND
jgi:DNA-binding CsgD family transcriptional regulator